MKYENIRLIMMVYRDHVHGVTVCRIDVCEVMLDKCIVCGGNVIFFCPIVILLCWDEWSTI